jgi:glutamine synthetase
VRPSLPDRAGCWGEAQHKAAAEIRAAVASRGLGVVRLAAVDQHGLLRGKTILAGELEGAFRDGSAFVSTLLAKDTSCRTVFPVFTAGAGLDMRPMQGAADVFMLPDPATFKVLPWAPHSGWMLCDLYFADGTPVPFSTRQIYRRALDRLHAAGFDFVAGLEVEFHIFKLENARLAPDDAGQPGPPPEVSLLTRGYQLLSEQHYDLFDPIYETLRRDLQALDLPLRSMEVELGPSQAEFTLRTETDMAAADTMVLLRSAVKQICRRHGFHATFMCRPRLPNICSSGWHLNQSLRDRKTGANAFIPAEAAPLSDIGMTYLGGVLAHASASAPFAAPTINGYRRFRPYVMAPDRIIWGRDNRGALLRVISASGDPASRIENRLGEPTANPYLYMASQIFAGLDGLTRRLDPGPSADLPYETTAAALPRDLGEALQALSDDACYRAGFGDTFIDYFVRLKEAELARYRQAVPDWKERDPYEVSDWEHREYFDLF